MSQPAESIPSPSMISILLLQIYHLPFPNVITVNGMLSGAERSFPGWLLCFPCFHVPCSSFLSSFLPSIHPDLHSPSITNLGKPFLDHHSQHTGLSLRPLARTSGHPGEWELGISDAPRPIGTCSSVVSVAKAGVLACSVQLHRPRGRPSQQNPNTKSPTVHELPWKRELGREVGMGHGLLEVFFPWNRKQWLTVFAAGFVTCSPGSPVTILTSHLSFASVCRHGMAWHGMAWHGNHRSLCTLTIIPRLRVPSVPPVS